MPTTIKSKDSADDSDRKSEDEAPEELHKQIDDAVVDFKTSSQTINAVVGGVKTGGNEFSLLSTVSVINFVITSHVAKDNFVNV